MEIPSALYGEVDTSDLDTRMKAVTWHNALSRLTDEACNTSPLYSWEKEEGIEGIITDLGMLGKTEGGLGMASRLKMKFWVDTPLEAMIPNLNGQKSGLEISQRFYFFEGEEGITLNEAYRFLCHRWREKQWNAQKKGTVTPGAATPAGGSSTGAGGRLLPKRRPGKGSKLKG